MEAELEKAKEEIRRLRNILDVNGISSEPVGVVEADAAGTCSPFNDEVKDRWRSVSEHGLSAEDISRYSRQIIMPGFTAQGQAKLKNASVLVVGLGGLGSPAALYLTAAGIGRLGLVDSDMVEASNLHRQVIHSERTVGTPKVDSAAAACRALNSSITISAHHHGLSPDNALQLVQSYDVVLDCTDNPPSRYLLNDACVASNCPLVSGAGIGLEGQLAVYNYGQESCCYRCMFPTPRQAGQCQRCADAGVLGVVPGIIGCMQALEAIKIITGVGTVLTKLLLFDASAASFHGMKLPARKPGCAACGTSPTELRARIGAMDRKAFTAEAHDAGPTPLSLLASTARIAAADLAAKLPPAHGASPGCSESYKEGYVLVDVRPPHEFAFGSLPGAMNLPWSQSSWSAHVPELLRLCAPAEEADAKAASRPIFVICRRGNDSQRAVSVLHDAGLKDAYDVKGGLVAWRADVDPEFPAY
ncbi:Adenylyltransferase and sulfurtransferase MOCS3 [Cymbomonas tetramitiformis]|uniref:Adenylyltransferase and sulfurtransferase MOCS3 n=1 Tax=Cymbomonas tetramitiformis TaxID=36881 RepID=A0AAE0BDT3_9CHLO|nr:Adenylyltransferase and sulfurtransferase MOCS3 [Cymbomonas tetramitiformis]